MTRGFIETALDDCLAHDRPPTARELADFSSLADWWDGSAMVTSLESNAVAPTDSLEGRSLFAAILERIVRCFLLGAVLGGSTPRVAFYEEFVVIPHRSWS